MSEAFGEAFLEGSTLSFASSGLSWRDSLTTRQPFKIIELCGVSDKSYAEATKNAVAKAAETLRNLDWFEVLNQRGVIKNGEVAEFQVVLKVGFRLESRQGSRLMPGLPLRDFLG
jgi:hypothetical protein